MLAVESKTVPLRRFICNGISLKMANVFVVVFAGKWVLGIVIDPCENKLYYTDGEKHSVNMVMLNTGERKKILNTGSAKPGGLALDRRAR